MVSYTDEGDGERVVLGVHGMPGSVRDYRWLAPCLAERLRFIRVDLPGFGGTPASSGRGITPVSRARFVLEFIQAMGLDRPVLLGHSMGSVVACAAAFERAEALGGIALLSSPGLRPHKMLRRRSIRPMARLLSVPWLARALLPGLRRGFVASGFRGPYPDEALILTILSVDKIDIPSHAERVRGLAALPCLMAWSSDDPLIEHAISDELSKALPPGPRLVFGDGGHNPQKAHAVEIAEAIAAWFPSA